MAELLSQSPGHCRQSLVDVALNFYLATSGVRSPLTSNKTDSVEGREARTWARVCPD